jgi:hypothetical protein
MPDNGTADPPDLADVQCGAVVAAPTVEVA